MFAPGTVVDRRYEIGPRLASGGMGHVYRARRVLLGDEVAIKVINAAGDEARTLHARFMRESRSCAQLRHPNIVSILDFSVAPDGELYLVMEYLNGPSLRDQIQAGGPLGLERVQEIVPPLCSALQLAHDAGVVHRDLKPANIVSHRFGSGEVVHKIIDFGIADLKDGPDTCLTGKGQFLGTVLYASPEQLRGEEVDGRGDIYSLGVVVFEMLTGRTPFQAGTPLGVATRHLCDAPPRPSDIVPALPAWLDASIAKALAKDRRERWASIAEFGTSLLAGGPGREPTATGGSRSFRSDLLAKYDLGPVIAAGRLGSEVHSGTHRALGLPVAIRLLRRAGRRDWDFVRNRFLKEARSLQVLHPSVIQVRDFGEENDTLYIVTELIEGRSLVEVLDAEAPFAWPRAWRLVDQLIDATAALHRHGALACGINPDVIRMTSDQDGERLMISVGGISHVRELLASLADDAARGGELGSGEFPYVAPEVLTNRPVEVPADIFAIGALAYEMTTGTQPYVASSLPELIGVMMTGSPKDPCEIAPGIPALAGACLLQCLEREPGARFASAAALRAAWRSTMV